MMAEPDFIGGETLLLLSKTVIFELLFLIKNDFLLCCRYKIPLFEMIFFSVLFFCCCCFVMLLLPLFLPFVAQSSTSPLILLLSSWLL
jgi:hypothetical protein